MRKVLVLFVLVTSLLLFQQQVKSYSSGAPTATSGAPGETSCAAGGCHNSWENSGPGSLTININPDNYVPGTVHSISVSIIDTSKVKYGFQLTGVDQNGKTVGSFTSTGGLLVQPGFEKQYVGHQGAGTNSSWSILWHAPANAVGEITFYASGNAADGDQTPNGDNIYTTQLTVKPDSLYKALSQVDEAGIVAFPNPAKERLNLFYKIENRTSMQLDIVSIEGKIVKQIFYGDKTKGVYRENIAIPPELATGIYFVRFQTERETKIEKIYLKK